MQTTPNTQHKVRTLNVLYAIRIRTHTTHAHTHPTKHPQQNTNEMQTHQTRIACKCHPKYRQDILIT